MLFPQVLRIFEQLKEFLLQVVPFHVYVITPIKEVSIETTILQEAGIVGLSSGIKYKVICLVKKTQTMKHINNWSEEGQCS